MFKKTTALLCFLLLALSAQAESDLTCRVVSITDGDTLTCLLVNNKQLRVRLQEIDAPEKSQPFGNRARLGMAWAYRKYVKNPVYLEVQQQAQQQKIGLWQEPNPVEPSLFRQYNKTKEKN